MKIFGEDGFRDLFKKGLLEEKFLNKFFSALDIFLKRQKVKKVFIGYDTRFSSKYLIHLIIKNLISIKLIYVGNKPLSTPCLYYSSKQRKSFSIMITASHFQKNFNGFKFFYRGRKLDKNYEKKILSLFKYVNKNKYKIKQIVKKVSLHENYLRFINERFNFNNINKKILVDFANGSTSVFKNKLNFLKNCNKINYLYNGHNINEKCGSNFLKKNINKKNFKKFNYCIAFDGDGDRALFSKQKYGIIESEKIAIIFLNYFKYHKGHSVYNVVSTKIVNPWLKEYLKNENNIRLYKTKVGDRNIINKQIKVKSILGFETSGHYSFYYAMDGIYAAGLFLEILKENPELIDKIINIPITYKLKIFNFSSNCRKDIKRKLKLIKNKGNKIIVRKSIWKDTTRIYLFHKKDQIK